MKINIYYLYQLFISLTLLTNFSICSNAFAQSETLNSEDAMKLLLEEPLQVKWLNVGDLFTNSDGRFQYRTPNIKKYQLILNALMTVGHDLLSNSNLELNEIIISQINKNTQLQKNIIYWMAFFLTEFDDSRFKSTVISDILSISSESELLEEVVLKGKSTKNKFLQILYKLFEVINKQQVELGFREYEKSIEILKQQSNFESDFFRQERGFFGENGNRNTLPLHRLFIYSAKNNQNHSITNSIFNYLTTPFIYFSKEEFPIIGRESQRFYDLQSLSYFEAKIISSSEVNHFEVLEKLMTYISENKELGLERKFMDGLIEKINDPTKVNDLFIKHIETEINNFKNSEVKDLNKLKVTNSLLIYLDLSLSSRSEINSSGENSNRASYKSYNDIITKSIFSNTVQFLMNEIFKKDFLEGLREITLSKAEENAKKIVNLQNQYKSENYVENEKFFLNPHWRILNFLETVVDPKNSKPFFYEEPATQVIKIGLKLGILKSSDFYHIQHFAKHSDARNSSDRGTELYEHIQQNRLNEISQAAKNIFNFVTTFTGIQFNETGHIFPYIYYKNGKYNTLKQNEQLIHLDQFLNPKSTSNLYYRNDYTLLMEKLLNISNTINHSMYGLNQNGINENKGIFFKTEKPKKEFPIKIGKCSDIFK